MMRTLTALAIFSLGLAGKVGILVLTVGGF